MFVLLIKSTGEKSHKKFLHFCFSFILFLKHYATSLGVDATCTSQSCVQWMNFLVLLIKTTWINNQRNLSLPWAQGIFLLKNYVAMKVVNLEFQPEKHFVSKVL